MTCINRYKDTAAASGVATFAVLPAWDAILSLPPPSRSFIAILSVLGVNLIVFLSLILFYKYKTSLHNGLKIVIYICFSAILFESAAFFYYDFKATLALITGPSNYFMIRDALLLVAAVLLAFIILRVIRFGPKFIYRISYSISSLFGLLPIILITSYLYHPSPEVSIPRTEESSKRAVVVVVFDELDDSFLDANVAELPNFSSMYKRSLVAKNVFPPANYTSESIPGLLTGKLYKATDYSRRGAHVLNSQPDAKWVSLGTEDHLFADAIKNGARVSIIGWLLPYCKIFTQAHSCWDDINFRAPGHSVSIIDWLAGHSRILTLINNYRLSQIEENISEYSITLFSSPQHYHLQRIGEIFGQQKAETLKAIKNQRSELIYSHLACPHAPSIDRSLVNKLDVFDAYKQNLRECDAFLGDLLKELDNVGFENGWTLIVTSDHWFRARDWLEAGKPNTFPSSRRTVPFYLTNSNQYTQHHSDNVSNSRFLRSLSVKALSPEFNAATAKVIIESHGDDITILRPF